MTKLQFLYMIVQPLNLLKVRLKFSVVGFYLICTANYFQLSRIEQLAANSKREKMKLRFGPTNCSKKQNTHTKNLLIKGRLSYNLCVECFSQLRSVYKISSC